MPVIETNGLSIAYRRAGAGPPLVLLHGFICDSRIWRPQLEELSRDFDVIAWDAPGCGESSDPAEEFTMAQYADCLAALLDDAGVAAAHICGLSWGGTAALEFYRLHRDRVASLILADSYAGWTGSLGREEAERRLSLSLRQSEIPTSEWVPQFLAGALSEAAPAALRAEASTIVSSSHPAGFCVMAREVTGDYRAILGRINVPTLLIWGGGDQRSPLSVARAMYESIRGARLVTIPGAGHLSNMEQPGRFNAEVRRFCQAVPPQRAEQARGAQQ